MRLRFITALLFISLSNFAQSQIQDAPEHYTKIHFKYTVTSNYYIDEKGVYADSLLLKTDFPNKKFSLTKLPTDTLNVVGFIPHYDFNEGEKTTLIRNIARYCSYKEITFNTKKKQATITHYNPSLSHLPKYLADFIAPKAAALLPVNTTSTITYMDNQMCRIKNTAEDTVESYKNKTIHWIEGMDYVGMFDYPYGAHLYKNVVYVNPKLNKYIVPTLLFSNCEYGIEKIEAIPFTVVLVYVAYE